MSTHEINELYKSGLKQIRVVSASRAADTATLAFTLEKVESEPTFTFGEEVTLTEDGNVIFHGYVADAPEVRVTANGITCNVKLSNIVALLDVTPYTGDQSLYGLWFQRTRVATAANAIQHILGTLSAGESYAVDFDATIRCPIGSGSQSKWSMVNSCLHWVPDAVTWYDPAAKQLLFRSANGGSALTIDVQNGKVLQGDSELFTFAGITEANFRPRYDLCPPAVGLVWERMARSIVIPSGETLEQPWAFQFQIPAAQGARLTPEEKAQVQQQSQPKMLVQGRLVPISWQTTANMKDRDGSTSSKSWQEFWSSFASMRVLTQTDYGVLSFGNAIFEPLSVDEAFPATDDTTDSGQPANYEPFTKDGSNIYVLYQGQFPASSKASDNVSGLKFCRGKLKQYVWLNDKWSGTCTKEEAQAFFSGVYPLLGGSVKNANYARLALDAVFINRRRKKYTVGTNQLDATDEDYTEDEDDDSGSGDTSTDATMQDYLNAATSYYQGTRKLFFDGSIVLRGVTGYSPAMLAGANLNVVGVRDDWADMNTPIVQAEYDPQKRELVISTGSPEILTIDERVQRMLLGRQSSVGAGTEFVDPPESASEDDSGEEDAFPMISPSMTANTVATKTGKPLNPFQLYEDDGKWYIHEGTLAAPGGRVINFPTTDVTSKVEANENAKFSVRVERDATSNEWVAVVRTITTS